MAYGKSKALLVISLLIVTTVALSVTGGASEPPHPLHELCWPAKEWVGVAEPQPIAIILSAKGQQIEVDCSKVVIEQNSFYGSPLECCVAAVRAITTEKEKWWGLLAAPAAARTADGHVRDSFSYDSSYNTYNMFTFHKHADAVPRRSSGAILSYLRIGHLHVFEVKWSLDLDGTPIEPVSSAVTVEEVLPGKFALATEYMRPENNVNPMIRGTQADVGPFGEYISNDPSTAETVALKGVFGNPAGHPLTLRLRVIRSHSHPLFAQVEEKNQAILGILAQTEEEWLQKGRPNEAPEIDVELVESLKPYFTPESIESFAERPLALKFHAPFSGKTGMVIDAKDYLIGFTRSSDGTLNDNYAGYVVQDGELLLANYGSETLLHRFLTKVAWPELRKLAEAHIED